MSVELEIIRARIEQILIFFVKVPRDFWIIIGTVSLVILAVVTGHLSMGIIFLGFPVYMILFALYLALRKKHQTDNENMKEKWNREDRE